MKQMQVSKFDSDGIKPQPQFKHNVELINKITLNLHMWVNKHACSEVFTINKSAVFVNRLCRKVCTPDILKKIHSVNYHKQVWLFLIILKLSNSTSILPLISVIKCIFLNENIPVTEALFLIIVYCLKTYCYIFDLCLWKRQILYCLHLF